MSESPQPTPPPSELRKLGQRDWSWTLYAAGERRFLSVLCGTVAMYELTVELDPAERERVGEIGFLDAFAHEVAYRPTQWHPRHLRDFRAPPD